MFLIITMVGRDIRRKTTLFLESQSFQRMVSTTAGHRDGAATAVGVDAQGALPDDSGAMPR
jgi:hypothetical protein